MLLQIGQRPESDFSEPIGMLEDCHKRIIYFLKTLLTVALTADEGPLSQDQHKSLETALKYFREGAPRHTADEEESLFPQLRLKDGPQMQAVFANINGLEQEHRWAESQHQDIDETGRRWLLRGDISTDDRLHFKALVKHLLHFYTRHIAQEEREVFSAARALLSSSEIEKLGREMAQRRGIAFPDSRG